MDIHQAILDSSNEEKQNITAADPGSRCSALCLTHVGLECDSLRWTRAKGERECDKDR